MGAQVKPTRPFPRPLVGALALLLAGCPASEDKSRGEDTPTESAAPESPAQRAKTSPAIKGADLPRVVEWLDPEATGVLVARGDALKLDPHVVAAVFALPPATEDLLEPIYDVDWALEASLPKDTKAADLFGDVMMTMHPGVASGVYVVRPLKVSNDAFVKLLGDAFLSEEIEGITIWRPKGAFPYKIAMLDEGLVAMIPVEEIGSGLAPLTAGRDLPPSPVEEELTKTLAADPDMLLAGTTAGPVMHLELDDDVARARLTMRRFKRSGLDVEVAFQVMGDADAAAKQLDAHDAPAENDQVRTLAKNVAFSLESGVVVGRLQVLPEDVANLRSGS